MPAPAHLLPLLGLTLGLAACEAPGPDPHAEHAPAVHRAGEDPPPPPARDRETLLAELDGEGTEIEAGRYRLGCPAHSPAECSERLHPEAEITLSWGFWIARTELTQELYEAVTGENPSQFKHPLKPVHDLSWIQAVAFANALSEAQGLEPCYQLEGEGAETEVRWLRGFACRGYRLPTEAEWEVAARAGETHDFSGSELAHEVAWFQEEHGQARIGPSPVASLSRNAWGLHDMSGNVNEWVWDRWSLPEEQPMGRRDPVGPAEGSARVHRGGSWHSTERGVRVFTRAFHPIDRANTRYGVRLARSLEQQPE